MRLGRGMPVRYAHVMGPLVLPYNDELARLAGFPKLPPVNGRLFLQLIQTAMQNLATFKTFKYQLVNDEEFIVVKDVEQPSTKM